MFSCSTSAVRSAGFPKSAYRPASFVCSPPGFFADGFNCLMTSLDQRPRDRWGGAIRAVLLSELSKRFDLTLERGPN